MLRDLAELLAPVSEEAFLEHFLEKKRLHVRAPARGRAAALLPWSEINRLVQSDVLPVERLRVIRANMDLLPAMYRDTDTAQRLRPRALQALLAQGASLIINGISDLVPPIGYLSDAIERRLGHRAWVNAYLSFGRGSALKAHWDGHDVLVLQVHGTKRWRSFGTPVPYPVPQHNAGSDLEKTVAWEGVLEPGDVLYLPRGEVHEAAVEGQNSVHLTIGIETPCAMDYLGWLAGRAAHDVLVRKDLTRLGGRTALEAHEARLKERLHALLDTTSIADYLEAEDARRKPRVLLNLGTAATIDSSALVVPTPRRRIPIPAVNDGAATISLGDEKFQLSPAGRQVLQLLLTRNGLAFAELRAALASEIEEERLREAVLDLAKQGLVGIEST